MAYIITEADEYTSDTSRDTFRKPLAGYRVKEVRYGDRMDVEIYPYWGKHPGIRCKKLKESRRAQKNQNAKDARKMFVRLLMNNFGNGDLHVTATYAKVLPFDDAVQMRDAQNFIRRWQRARRRAGLGKGKYMYVMEGGADGNTRKHIHFVLEGGLDRDAVEQLWHNGHCNADRIRGIDGDIKALAEYLAKDPKGRKRWGASRGLKRPTVKIYDHKVTRKKAREMARDEASFAAALEKLYPDFRAVDINPPKYSEYVAGAYLCADMRRIT